MKKLLFCALLATSVFVFGYTQIDVDNANYLGSKNIITYQSAPAGYRLDDSITRAEVVAIALKIKRIQYSTSYKCKKYFSDTVKNDWICRAVELAADNGLVSRSNKKFRPQEKITRVEALSMVINVSGNYESPLGGPHFADANGWQYNLLSKAYHYFPGIFVNTLKDTDPECEMEPCSRYYFYPNRNATRADVFGFARNILESRTNISGEVSLDTMTINLSYISENASGLSAGSVCNGSMKIWSQNITVPKNVAVLKTSINALLDKKNDPSTIEFGPWNVVRMYELKLDSVNIINGVATIKLKNDENYLAHTTSEDRLSHVNGQSGGIQFSGQSLNCAIKEQINALAKQFSTVTKVKLYINNELISEE